MVGNRSEPIRRKNCIEFEGLIWWSCLCMDSWCILIYHRELTHSHWESLQSYFLVSWHQGHLLEPCIFPNAYINKLDSHAGKVRYACYNSLTQPRSQNKGFQFLEGTVQALHCPSRPKKCVYKNTCIYIYTPRDREEIRKEIYSWR